MEIIIKLYQIFNLNFRILNDEKIDIVLISYVLEFINHIFK